MTSKGPIRAALNLARGLGGAGASGDFTRDPAELPSRAFRAMGTLSMVTLGASYAGRIESVTEHIRAIFGRLESEMSAYRPDSAISELSKKAGVAPVAVSEDTYRVLSLGRHFGRLSEGAFDNTASPLVSLWGFNGATVPAALPSDQSINELLKLVDYRRLVLRDGTAFLPERGMAVDVGGIAKGYAVDRAYDYCRRAGIQDFLIDFSGNMRASDRPRWGERWQVGVRDPFDRSHLLGKITLPTGMAVSTSGGYERFVNIAHQRFCHIIDPRTGYPVANTATVTVLCGEATAADALSTAFFVLGLQGASQLLAGVPSVELLIVPDRYPPDLWLTPGFAKAFTPAPKFADRVRVLSAKS